MRRTLLFAATTALAMLVACGVALAASINCPTASGGYCYGTNQGDTLYGTPTLDRIYGYGGSDLMYGYGGADSMYGGNETGLGDKMRGGTGADRVNAQDGEKDTITCEGSNDLVYYDRRLDMLEGCTANGLIELPPPDGLFEPGTKVLLSHGSMELCLPEKALEGHLKHGDEVLNWSGCTEQK
jgi:hypothetical protein